MNIGSAKITYELTDEVFERILDKKISNLALNAFVNRFENVLVGVKDVAHIHGVCGATVTNYINDGLIEPEIKLSENEHPKFRLSYVLTLDFQELKKDLIARNKGWKS